MIRVLAITMFLAFSFLSRPSAIHFKLGAMKIIESGCSDLPKVLLVKSGSAA